MNEIQPDYSKDERGINLEADRTSAERVLGYDPTYFVNEIAHAANGHDFRPIMQLSCSIATALDLTHDHGEAAMRTFVAETEDPMARAHAIYVVSSFINFGGHPWAEELFCELAADDFYLIAQHAEFVMQGWGECLLERWSGGSAPSRRRISELPTSEDVRRIVERMAASQNPNLTQLVHDFAEQFGGPSRYQELREWAEALKAT